MIVYVSIGNSDDKLTQQRWSAFCLTARAEVRRAAQRIIGEWYSGPASQYQNACFAADIGNDPDHAEHLKMKLAQLREDYGQDSIAWAEAPKTEFL